ncbi:MULTISPECIES: transcriptional regulator [Sphingobium]|uniref:Transcriptional regulator n=1 Tax=Sphingobium limneticum TaxID=1007511 RepID=A0A5J5HS48_9SPHN|nr:MULTISPECIES: transcriptional regulator [Sphingobium]KAA9011856.1 transcriptional regulator [Sphingobium limneticum]KAA9025191.1 transcriptional regulator [Sphingobium limneticum]
MTNGLIYNKNRYSDVVGVLSRCRGDLQMTLQSPKMTGSEALSLIKELSGKLIERRRRRDRITQRHMARGIGRSERWVREIEAGVETSMIEDHIRCAHALRMTTLHLFIPLLAVEHDMPIPRELLMHDDLWDLEREMLEVVARHQSAILTRITQRSLLGGSR